MSRPVHAALPELVRKGAEPVETFKPASPTGRNCFKAPACPGKCPAAGTDGIGVTAKIDGGEHRIFERQGVHEAGERRMRTAHRVKGGIRIVSFIVSKNRVDFSIRAKRAGRPERLMP